MHVRHKQQEHHLRHDADQGPRHDQHHIRSRGTRPQVHRARIFKLLRCPGIEFKESIPPAYVAPVGRYDNPICCTRSPGYLKSLKIRALFILLAAILERLFIFLPPESLGLAPRENLKSFCCKYKKFSNSVFIRFLSTAKDCKTGICCHQRDGEYKQRSYLRGFCHYPHRGVDAGRHSCKNTEHKSTESPILPLLNVMYCVRVSLWQSKYSLGRTKERGVVGNL
jgi:hypothetical protein